MSPYTLSGIAAVDNLPTNQSPRHDTDQEPTVSIPCLSSEMTDQDMIKHLEQQPEQFELRMTDEIQCWEMQQDDLDALMKEANQTKVTTGQRDNIIAFEQESDRWINRINAMIKKWMQLKANQDEGTTIDEDIHAADTPESSPTLPMKETSAIKPSSNPYSLLSGRDSPQSDKTIDVPPERQLK